MTERINLRAGKELMPVLESRQRGLKRKKLRHAEYYDMQRIFDKLYAASGRGENFYNLLEIIGGKENILLAYRNIKRNDGAMTPGVDGYTIADVAEMERNKFIEVVQGKLAHYRPKPVRRVEIPKDDGRTRPLGIPSILDRIVQQSILQVLEPICEAKFNEHSYGFRPNRSVEHAIADYAQRVNLQGIHFVVDVDIKGFFDNVNHTKLIRQIWAMGIRDKRLISIIRKMLKADVVHPDGEIETPERGTPQGGVLSPLLSNIVLNELDWWISSQWETCKTRRDYTRRNPNGAPNRGHTFRALRNTSKLKEIYIVRYADDFRILCRTRNDAERIFTATQEWLKERLKLDINAEKSKIVNLRKANSNFLGFRFKARKKAHKRVICSHMSVKAVETVTRKLTSQVKRAQNAPHWRQTREIWRLNEMVIGIHNYYALATLVSKDCAKIGRIIDTVIKNRFKKRVKREGELDPKGYIYKKYGKSRQLRFIKGQPVLPIAYVRHRYARGKAYEVNQYTPEGRLSIHQNLKMDSAFVKRLIENACHKRGSSVEYEDNQISRYYGQYGKCAISGSELGFEGWRCHRIVPKGLGGRDSYQNLILVSEGVYQILNAADSESAVKYLESVQPDESMLKKINLLRGKANLEPLKARK
jgi:group II intron reverse transcriptase/maturase